MKRRGRQLRTPPLVLVGLLLLFAATTLLQRAHFASASTATATGTAAPSSTSSSDRAGVLGTAGDETNDPNEVANGENENEGDDGATAAEKATEKRQKSSWQFFYRKDETAETDENEEEGKNDSNDNANDNANDNDDGGASRFRFGIRRRRNRDEVDDGKKLEGMFTTSDAEDRDPSEESNESEAKNTGEDNSEAAKPKNESESDHDDSSKENDESSVPSPETKDGGDKNSDGDAEPKKDGEAGDETRDAGKDDAPESGNKEPPQDPMQQYIEQYQNAQRMQQQRLMGYPGAIIYRSPPMRQHPHHPMRPGMPPQDGGLPGIGPGHAMAAAALVNLLTLASRIFFLKWLIDRLAFESESKSPVQHFMWECLNDKFVKDDEIWKRVLGRAPQSMGVSRRRWGRTVRAMGPQKKKQKDPEKKQKRGSKRKNGKSQQQQLQQQQGLVVDPTKNDQVRTQQLSKETSKTVVVMDFSTVNVPNPDFLRFADVVTFLVGSNGPGKQLFGPSPEVVLLLQSPGGEVTSFAFAAAQVARLRNAGWNVTVCVDRIAASGGYMIASQATQILASPFAMVGSVGVITESLNFYEILKQHGIQSLVLKAGDSKNPLTQFGKVTDEDIETTQKDLDETHQSFIDLCRSRRPGLDPAVCNGRILSGDKALERGMIDRILTSDEYILEKIAEGDLVMKLHLVSGNSERHMIANALQILPHLSSRFKRFVFAGGGDNNNNNNNVVKRALGKLSSWVDGRVRMDGNFASRVVQLVGLASMVRRAVGRSGSFVPEEAKNDYNNYY